MSKAEKKSHAVITRESLRLFEPISSLSDERLDELVSLSYVESVGMGVSIFREGDVDNQTIYILKGDVQLTSSTANDETTIRSNSKEGKFPLDDSQPRQCSAVAMSSVELVRIDNSVLDYMMMWDQLAVAEISNTDKNIAPKETEEDIDDKVEKLVEQAVLDSIADAKEPDRNLESVDKIDFTKTIKPELKKDEKSEKLVNTKIPENKKDEKLEKSGNAKISESKKTEEVEKIDNKITTEKNKDEKVISDKDTGEKQSQVEDKQLKENKDKKWQKKSEPDPNAQTTVNEAIKINDKISSDDTNNSKQKKSAPKEQAIDKTENNKVESKKTDKKITEKNQKVQNIKPDVTKKGQDTIVYESRDWIRKIRQIMAFKNMPPANIKNLLEKMESVNVKNGDKIIEQGGDGDYYYIVTDGTAIVTRTIELASLSAGTSFGEEALVAKSPRNASVTMTSDGILMRLSKKDFDELLIEPLMARVSPDEARSKILQGAKWLDVRHAKEFHHSRLPGAINIPLHELRLRMSELDKETEYICCCRTGARSSSGSFLLAQNGFKVSLLTGGIQVMSQDLRR